MESIIYINETKVCELLNWNSTIDAVKAALQRYSQGKAVQNARGITTIKNRLHLYTMPGYFEDDQYGSLACKLVTSCNNENGAKKLPNIIANIALFDENTGLLLAVIAGTNITAWRTAAASVIATQQLAKKFDVLAIVGAGVQGCIHAEAFQHFFNIKKVQIWNRSMSKATNLAIEINKRAGSDIAVICESVQECLLNADIIVTATGSKSALVKREFIKDGAHINAVGVCGGILYELDADVYEDAHVFVDSRHGEISNTNIKIIDELGALINNSGEYRREIPGQITIFQSLGMAVEDCAMARLVYDNYIATIN